MPFDLGDQQLHVTASVGVSVYPGDGDSGDVLVRNAHASMYRSKEQGRNRLQFYTAELSVEAQQRVAIENALHFAVQRKEFALHYQPKIDLDTGRINGVEALVRWRSPELGLVPPDRFIPLAEETGLIAPIGEWVLRTACEQLMAWREAGLSHLTVAVNLSPVQFELQDITALTERVLRETGLPAACLGIEITESALMRDSGAIIDTLRRLSGMGVTLFLDDFGTGYSSLSYLQRFPIDVIKIDRSFIRDVTSNAGDASISRAIIAMARSLGMKTVAEGVDTHAQVDFLRTHRCDMVQGYYYSPPLPAEELTRRLLTSAMDPGTPQRRVRYA